MQRREFIIILAGASVSSTCLLAQNSPIPKIGFLHVGSAKPFAHIVAGLQRGLKETGYVDGQNLIIEYRWAEGQTSRLPEMAADLVRREVAVLVTGGGEAPAFAARTATS